MNPYRYKGKVRVAGKCASQSGCAAVPSNPNPHGREKYMKAKKHHATVSCGSDAVREHEVNQEIDSFLRAVRSYPERFAREPYMSFQQHLSSIVTAAHPRSRDE